MTRQNQLFRVFAYHKQAQVFKEKHEHSEKRNEKQTMLTADLNIKFSIKKHRKKSLPKFGEGKDF